MFEYLARGTWDTSGLPRLGDSVPRSVRTEAIIHHTVSQDNDTTPTIWETLEEIKKHMRVLQQIRPDLGLDVPYNFVAFCRPGDTITVCEGRGFDLSGAHTKYHNTTGLATSFAANFQDYPLPNIVPSLNEWLGFMKASCPNLAVINGHRDYTGANSPHPNVGGTACPGANLYATKPQWAFTQEDDDMTQAEFNAMAEKWVASVTGNPNETLASFLAAAIGNAVNNHAATPHSGGLKRGDTVALT